MGNLTSPSIEEFVTTDGPKERQSKGSLEPDDEGEYNLMHSTERKNSPVSEESESYVMWLDGELRAKTDRIGGKAEGIVRLMRFGFNVPRGFVVSSSAYNEFLGKRIKGRDNILRKRKTRAMSKLVRNAILARSLPTRDDYVDTFTNDVSRAYGHLCALEKVKNVGVAVRSSGLHEDSKKFSLAGAYATFLNVKGIEQIMDGILKCWASLWKPHTIRMRKGLGIFERGGVAVLIQRMIKSEVSGVTFTAHPLTNDKEKMLVNASWGQGASVVSGLVDADMYLLSKPDLTILRKRIGRKAKRIDCLPDQGTRQFDVPEDVMYEQALTDEKILQLATICQEIEEAFGHPVDIEWAFSRGELYVTQARPVTTIR